jgi:hypothetical protein
MSAMRTEASFMALLRIGGVSNNMSFAISAQSNGCGNRYSK